MTLRSICTSTTHHDVCLTDERVIPRMIAVDSRNRFVKDLAHRDADSSAPERRAVEA
jgi:hypothetical protein